MRQFYKIFTLFLACVLLWACSDRLADPLDVNPLDESPAVFYAAIESDATTRTVLGNPDASGIRTVRWSIGDEINVGKKVYKAHDATSQIGENEINSFSWSFYGSGAAMEVCGYVSATGSDQERESSKNNQVYKAFYPASLRAADGTTSLPQTQFLVYEAGKVRIDHLPMFGSNQMPERRNANILLGNMCAVLEVSLTGEGSVKRIDVESLDGAKLCGPFEVTEFTTNQNTQGVILINNLSIAMTGTPSANYSKVTLDCTGVPGGGVALSSSPTNFYIAIPPATYAAGSLRIKVWNTYDVAVGNFTSKAVLNAERNKIYTVSKNLDNSNSAPPTINGLLIAPGDLYEDASGTLRIAETWDEFIPDNAPEKTYFSWKYLWENVLTTGRSGNAYNESSATTGTVDLPLRGKTYTWRLPYSHEWLNYIGKTTTRPGSTVNGESGYQFALIRLEYSDRYPKSDDAAGGTTTPLGLLIFPDNYRMTPSFTLPYRNSYRLADVNHGITYDQLTEYIEAGCVFLPGAGCVLSYPANPKGGMFNPSFGDSGNYHSANSLNLYIHENDGEGDANGPTGLNWQKINRYLSTRLIRVP